MKHKSHASMGLCLTCCPWTMLAYALNPKPEWIIRLLLLLLWRSSADCSNTPVEATDVVTNCVAYFLRVLGCCDPVVVVMLEFLLLLLLLFFFQK